MPWPPGTHTPLRSPCDQEPPPHCISDTHTHTRTHTHTHAHSSHMPAHTHSLSRARAHTYTHTHSLCLSHMRTYSHITHAGALTCDPPNSGSLPQTLRPRDPKTLRPRDSLNLGPPEPGTLRPNIGVFTTVSCMLIVALLHCLDQRCWGS